ncbi:MAG: phosphonate ABC transporter, permease protein PhnE [Alkalispirochaetaceae bacterium]
MSGNMNVSSSRGPKQKKPALVSPGVAFLTSLVLPGSGQVLARQVQRGFLTLAGMVSMVAILVWRISVLGMRVDGTWETFQHAFNRRPTFVVFVILMVIAVWIFGAIDAARCAGAGTKRGQPLLFIAMIAGFFVLGWQVSGIDVGKAVREFPQTLPLISRVLWPWEAAVEYEETIRGDTAEILIAPPEEAQEADIPEQSPPEESGEPYLYTEPKVGVLSQQDTRNLEVTEGTEITIYGRNFEPNKETELWWNDDIGNRFRIRSEGRSAIVETDEQGSFEMTFRMPFPVIGNQSDGDDPIYHVVEAEQVFLGDPRPSQALTVSLSRLVETIIMGMMATLFGILLSIPISFLAARNIMSGSWVTTTIYYLTRAVLNIVRSIEPLIWALIAVVWVGLGPFAGIVALTIHSIAALGKLYSEAIEGIDPGPIEAIQATGANRLQTIVFAVLPQMISPFISFSIYRWDINVRMSTVIGLVGGGGIGFILVQYIRLLDYSSAGIAVWFIAITVALLDYVSAEIRNKLM